MENNIRTDTVRIQYMLNAVSKYLQQIFKDRFQQLTGRAWSDGEECGQYFIINIDNLAGRPIDRRAAIRGGESSTWDLATLITAINAIHINQSNKINTENRHIENIKQIRNQVAHAPNQESIQLDQQKFEQFFKQLKEALLFFGEDEKEIEKYRTNDINSFSSGTTDPEFIKLKNEGEAAMKAKQFSKAIELFTKALALTKISQNERANTLVLRSDAAVELVKQRKADKNSDLDEDEEDKLFNRAIVDLKKAKQLIPDLRCFYEKKGKIFFERRDFGKAVLAFGTALVLDPGNKSLEELRGSAVYHDLASAAPSSRTINAQEEVANINTSYRANMDVDKLESILKRLSLEKNTDADVYRGLICASQVPPKYEAAFNLFMKAADKGDTRGMLEVAYCFKEGHGVKANEKKARAWFEKLAKIQKIDANVAQAQYCYAFWLLEGIGGPRDKSAAVEWLERAVENGNTPAMLMLGEMYLTGKNNVSEPAYGFRMLLEAAKKGEGAAMDKVGCCYMTGSGVAPNFTEARKWFERAIRKNYHQAHLNLSKLKELEEKTPKTHEDREERQQIINSFKLPEYSTAHIPDVTLKELHEAVFASTTPVALELQRAIKHAMGAFHIAEDIAQNNKPINSDMSIIFVEQFAAAVKITEKVLFVPGDLVPTMMDLVGAAMNRGATEDAVITNAILHLADPDMHQALLQLMKKAVKLFPKSRDIWKIASIVYTQTGKRNDAVEALKEALKLRPDDHELWFMLGSRYMVLKQYTESKKAFLKCIECARGNDDIERAGAYYGLGICAVGLDEKKEVRKYYNLGVEAEKYQIPGLHESYPDKDYLESILHYYPAPATPTKPVKAVSYPSEQSGEKPRWQYKGAFLQHVLRLHELLDPLTDFHREAAVKEIRELFKRLYEQGFEKPVTEYSPPHTSPLDGIKEHQMPTPLRFTYSLKNGELMGYVRGTVITRQTTTPSLTVIADDAGWCIIVHFKCPVMLKVGAVIDIYKAHYVASLFGGPALVVDDMTWFEIEQTPYTNVCWYCGINEAKMPGIKLSKCSKCPAYYCSKDCQVKDWKLMDHKSICFP